MSVTSATPYAKSVNNGSLYVRDIGNRCYWLRSPGFNQGCVAIVAYDGLVYADGDLVNFSIKGVRPTLWISYE